jgi:hypothetical protein
MLKKRKKGRYDSRVGGLGAAGGVLVIDAIYFTFSSVEKASKLPPEHAIDPAVHSILTIMTFYLAMMVVGFILIIIAVYYSLKGLIEDLAEKFENHEAEKSNRGMNPQ